MNGPAGAGVYARTLEQTLSRLRGRPVILSPRDWALASDWHARAIPLGAVVECLEEAAARSAKRGGSAPRSLAYVADAVEDVWRVIQQGRLDAPPATPSRPTRDALARRWCELARATPHEPLRRLLTALLERLAASEDPGALDRELDRRLIDHVPRELSGPIVDQVERDLAPFRSRMAQSRFEATRQRALTERLRRELGLPRLESSGPDANEDPMP